MADIEIMFVAAVGSVVFRLNNWALPGLVCLVVAIVYAVKVFLPYV